MMFNGHLTKYPYEKRHIQNNYTWDHDELIVMKKQLTHLDQIATTHSPHQYKHQKLIFMTPTNISTKKNSNHIRIHLETKKNNQQKKWNQKEKLGWNYSNGCHNILNQNQTHEKSGGHESFVRSGIVRLRRKVVRWGDKCGVQLEIHYSGCDFGCELYLRWKQNKKKSINWSKPTKNDYIGLVLKKNNKKSQFGLRILKTDLVGSVFDFLVS